MHLRKWREIGLVSWRWNVSALISCLRHGKRLYKSSCCCVQGHVGKLPEWGAVWAVVRVFRVWQTLSRVCPTNCMARTASLTMVGNSDIHVCMPVSEYKWTCGKPDGVFFRNCKVWLWFECYIISYLRTQWTCVHMLGDASGRDGLYSSSVSKTTGLGLFWGVQTSSIVMSSLVVLFPRRFNLKNRRNKTPLSFPLLRCYK